ncbi:MAG: ribosomal-processing cysteine protease Prp [Candidatus Eremiobacterota bacterium]
MHLRRDASNSVQEFACRGHAGFSQPGEDIVCAGVSGVIGALALGLTEVARLPVNPEASDGFFRVSRPPGLSAEQLQQWNLLVETAVLALADLERNYRGFLQVKARRRR